MSSYDPANASSIFLGLNPLSRNSPIRITGSDVSPSSINSSRALASRPTLRSVNATPFCDRYSVARWQGPQPTFV